MLAAVSRYRNALMGAAIVWVLLFHCGFSFSSVPLLAPAAEFVRASGYGGVDIFLFLSGFGLFQSLSHDGSAVSFYRRRLKRVLPAYLPVLAVWLLSGASGVPAGALPAALWNNLSGLAFWLERPPEFNWFILALPLYYLLAPAFFYLVTRWGRRGGALLLALTVLADICFLGRYVMVAVSRLTVFALGMLAGRRRSRGEESGPAAEAAVHVLGALGWALLYLFRSSLRPLLWDCGLYWFPFILITPSCVFALCRLFALLERARAGRAVSSALALMGAASLEIYLVHARWFETLDLRSNWQRAAAMAAAVVVGHAYHNLLSAVFHRRPQPDAPGQGEADRAPGGAKIAHLQFLRVAACFLVIVNHTAQPLFQDFGPSFTWFAGLAYFFVCKIAVPLFLMISGALLLEKEDTPRRWAGRILRAEAALIAASAVYYVYYGLSGASALSLADFFKRLVRVPLSNALWYLYLYLGLLCLLPVLQKLVKALDRRLLEWLLFLSLGVLGLFAMIHTFIPSFMPYWYFSSALPSAYIGMFLCGYYLERRAALDRKTFGAAAVVFVLLIAGQTAAAWLLYRRDPGSYMQLDNRAFVTVTASAVCFYVMVKYVFSKISLGPRLAAALNGLGELTFGIYLLSDLAIRLTEPAYQALCRCVHIIPATVLWELLIFAVCALGTLILKQLPIFEKWL